MVLQGARAARAVGETVVLGTMAPAIIAGYMAAPAISSAIDYVGHGLKNSIHSVNIHFAEAEMKRMMRQSQLSFISQEATARSEAHTEQKGEQRGQRIAERAVSLTHRFRQSEHEEGVFPVKRARPTRGRSPRQAGSKAQVKVNAQLKPSYPQSLPAPPDLRHRSPSLGERKWVMP